jgi:hypothetical protein
MIYVLTRKGFPERILIGAKDKVQMWQRLHKLLREKNWGTLKDWTLQQELKMVDWCCWVIR